MAGTDTDSDHALLSALRDGTFIPRLFASGTEI
jgi:hypothetical protein